MQYTCMLSPTRHAPSMAPASGAHILMAAMGREMSELLAGAMLLYGATCDASTWDLLKGLCYLFGCGIHPWRARTAGTRRATSGNIFSSGWPPELVTYTSSTMASTAPSNVRSELSPSNAAVTSGCCARAAPSRDLLLASFSHSLKATSTRTATSGPAPQPDNHASTLKAYKPVLDHHVLECKGESVARDHCLVKRGRRGTCVLLEDGGEQL